MKRETRKKTNTAAAFAESSDSNAEIAMRAHEIWLNEGGAHGADQDHWFRAEHELNGRPRQALAQGH